MPAKYPRRLSLSIEDPVFDSFARFAATAYPDQPVSAALREAALAYMGADPLDAARSAARRSAYLVAKIQFGTIMARAYREATALLEAQDAEARAELGALLAANGSESTERAA